MGVDQLVFHPLQGVYIDASLYMYACLPFFLNSFVHKLSYYVT